MNELLGEYIALINEYININYNINKHHIPGLMLEVISTFNEYDEREYTAFRSNVLTHPSSSVSVRLFTMSWVHVQCIWILVEDLDSSKDDI